MFDALIFYKRRSYMGIVKENNRDKSLDKNLQDDWIPDQQRRSGATSEAITEYGGDTKRKESIKDRKFNKASQKDPDNWKKKDVGI
jgi:hypothetical protein